MWLIPVCIRFDFFLTFSLACWPKAQTKQKLYIFDIRRFYFCTSLLQLLLLCVFFSIWFLFAFCKWVHEENSWRYFFFASHPFFNAPVVAFAHFISPFVYSKQIRFTYRIPFSLYGKRCCRFSFAICFVVVAISVMCGICFFVIVMHMLLAKQDRDRMKEKKRTSYNNINNNNVNNKKGSSTYIRWRWRVLLKTEKKCASLRKVHGKKAFGGRNESEEENK